MRKAIRRALLGLQLGPPKQNFVTCETDGNGRFAMQKSEAVSVSDGSFAARAQQPAMPVIGFLGFGALDTSVLYLAAFRKDLNEIGFVEGQNIAIEYRWAEDRYDRMPELAADLIRRRVVIIAIPGSSPTVVRAVQAATSAIPIVFGVGDDPVKVGLVASLSRPGGHATGINFFTTELVAKRLALLHELVPGGSRIGVLVNPANPARVESVLGDAQTAAISSRQPVLLPASGRRLTRR
jgi:putative tryptophan/tyrosine transport system substrate-binding protein